MSPSVDASLIAELFDRHAAALEFYAAQRTTSPQDCVQEAFLELARQPSPPDDPGAKLGLVPVVMAYSGCALWASWVWRSQGVPLQAFVC